MKFVHYHPKPGLHNINAHTKFGDNPLIFTKATSRNENMDMQRQTTVKNRQNLRISNSKPGLHNINANTKFGENPLIFTQVIIQKRK